MLSPVIQLDRDAAARFYEAHLSRPGEVPVSAHMRAGKIDESPLIQAFACHRLATVEAAAKVAERFAEPNGHPRTEFDRGYENSARKIAARLRAAEQRAGQP